MRITHLLIVFMLVIAPGGARSQTHFINSFGQMKEYTNWGPNRLLFTAEKTVVMLQFEASKGGLLCYVEEIDRPRNYNAPYNDVGSLSARSQEVNPYKPDRMACRLHICDASGEDKYVVPIEQRYGTYYNYAVFYGETAVGLQKVSRQEGKIYELIVNFKTGQKFGFNRGGLCDGTAAENGEHVLYKIENRIYMDGRMILPRYMENPPQVGVHPKEYRAREEEMHAQLAKSKIEMMPCDRLSYGAWSPDGRYFAFLDQSRIHAPYQETDRLRVLILDTEAVGPKKTFADYTRQMAIPDPAAINMTLQLKWEKATDSIVLHAYNSSEPLRSIKTSEMKGWTVAEPSTE